MKEKDDPTIERIREARHRISEASGHDPQKLVNYYLEMQQKYEQRLLQNAEQEETRTEPIKV